jgi:23S rRNA (uracil1939-C5)-methyltransferase
MIRDLTAEGLGVAEVTGKQVFVGSALPGEFIRFRRKRRRKNYDEAALVEVLRESSLRVTPPCEYFSVCGGCSLQHLEPAAQLEAKQNVLLDALTRIGKVEPEGVLPPLAGKNQGYRRRARLGARLVEKKGRVLVGFREKHSSYVAEMHSCRVLRPELSDLIDPLMELISSMSISRRVPQVEMSLGDAGISLVIRVLDPPTAADTTLLAEFGAAHNVGIWLQSGGPQTLAPLDPGKPPEQLWYELPEAGVRLEFGPLDFIQVNQDMNRLMIARALELLGSLEGKRVLDLFCGIGNFSLPLARQAAHVTGVELEAGMVAKARANAALNHLGNTEFHAADLSDPDNLPEWWQQGFDVVVLDPPRAGAAAALAAVAQVRPAQILYVSCHAGSLARDAGELVHTHGYRLKKAGAMDMFPHTSHVEAIALFELE